MQEKLKQFLGDDPSRSYTLARAHKRAIALSAALIDKKTPIPKLIENLQAHPLPYFDYKVDQYYIDHQIDVLTQLKTDAIVWKKITALHASPLSPDTSAHDLQKCVLSALLNPLRQAIGSCFATAPAIDVQRHHIEMFIDDIHGLLYHGLIKRTIEGIEMIAPLNPTAFQDMPLDIALLRAWEYTLASLSDYKLEFYRSNLIACLGLHPDEEGGIGQIVFNHISLKLEEANQIIQEHQEDVEGAFRQLKMAENFFNQSSSYSAARRHKNEWRIQAHQFDNSINMRDEAHDNAKHYAGFFNFINEHILAYFSEFFQEVYDPNMLTCKAALFEDSPAGFRLVYKHGRRDPSLWTTITNEEQYIECLSDFFKMIEGRLITECDWEDGQKDIPNIITAIIHHLQDPLFIKTCKRRAIALHKKVRTGSTAHSPWGYVSGGSMDSLLKCYFRIESPVQKEEKTITSQEDLLIFWIETLKNAPPKLTDPFLKSPSKSLYAHSPSHAFLLRPGLFKQAWLSKEFTYTWVRDHLISPAVQFYQSRLLSSNDQAFLIQRLKSDYDLALHGSQTTLSIPEFRTHLAEQAPDKITEIDSFIIRSLPLHPHAEVLKACKHLSLPDSAQKLIQDTPLLTSSDLADLTYAVSQDPSLVDELRTLGYLPPAPLFTADTNWPNMWFAFAYNPGTEELNLWRSDLAFRHPKPMHIWENDFKAPWGILMRHFP